MRLNNDYILREIAGEKVIIMQSNKTMDMTKIISLNATSEYLWQYLQDKEFTQHTVADALFSKYNVSHEQAESDAKSWIDKLIKLNLIYA
jgi:transposase-like protein